MLGIGGGLLVRRFPRLLKRIFILSALGSLFLLIISITQLNASTQPYLMPLGIAGYYLNFQLDSLAAIFICLLAAATVAISLFSSDYYHEFDASARSYLCFQYHWFLASMVWVLLAADVYSFMLAWEMMAFSSYFLIVGFNTEAEQQKAGFLYLLIAQFGALFILASFSLLLPNNSNFTFAAMQQAHFTPLIANAAFILALIGFGAKAGLLPVHIWLPEAHPAAPAPISALLSGVMLKTAIYGLLRVSCDILGASVMWWGMLVLFLGLLTAVFGVILAAMQTDMKRLLAYSSLENMGIIFAAVGLAIIFHANNLPVLAGLALVAALYHSINHALYKSLLFLGTGSVLHATAQRNLGKLGGLIKTMPWVALWMLIAILAISGLPPFNGFISEWLLLQALLFFPHIATPYMSMLIPIAAAILVLAVGLAAYVMVKFYGIIFLGRPRESELTNAKDATILQQVSLGGLASLCVLLGIFPLVPLRYLVPIANSLLHQPVTVLHSYGNNLFLVPIAPERASYSPLIFLVLILGMVLLVFLAIRVFFHGRMRRGPAWNCGFPLLTPRMQDSAEGFGQPIKHIFASFLRIELKVPTAFDKNPHYQVIAEDRFWYALYLPLLRAVSKFSGWISKLQRGKIAYYLSYSFITVLILWLLLL